MSELNLTAMLTTISAASASFVAILGGFIASKLLSIIGERDSVTGQIANLAAQIDQKQKREDWYRYQVNEHNAVSFIISHTNELYKNDPIQKIYDSDDSPGIDFDDLLPFWEKAVHFTKKFMMIDEFREEKNKDGVPLSLAALIENDNWLKDLLSDLRTIQAENQRKSMMAQLRQPYIEPSIKFFNLSRPILPQWYKKYWDKINSLAWEIEQLELQKGLLEQRARKLTTPYGMKRGLIIFVLFSVFNIILPLTQCNTVFKNPMCYYGVMLFFMVTFTLGLAATFLYLVSMLKWRPAAKVPVLPPEENDADEDENEEDSE